jgi:hypothetical protein
MFIEILHHDQKIYFFFEIFLCHPVTKGFQKSNFQLKINMYHHHGVFHEKRRKKAAKNNFFVTLFTQKALKLQD